ncbi:MAG: hypothetical protein U9Q83_00805 [Bacteroidota bacterium]|nr:hypothetical protein [Bacteroidota bacterium]
MKKKILIILSLFILISTSSFSQCRDFTTKKVVPKLDDFLLTGKYHSLILAEGDEILILKTLNKGLKYRFVIMGEDNINKPQFILLNWNNKVLFDNKNENFTSIYDYKCNKTERVKIVIKIPESSEKKRIIQEGCVCLVIGIKI